MSRKIFITLFLWMFIFGMSKLSFAMMCGGHKPGGNGLASDSQSHKPGGNGLASDSQSHSQHWQTVQAEPGDATTQATRKAVNAGNKICPVSGEKIDEKMGATYEYDGKIYNFCCPMCIDEFKKDPQKYIKKVEEELQAESKQKAAEEKMELEHETEPAGDEAVHRGHHQHQ